MIFLLLGVFTHIVEREDSGGRLVRLPRALAAAHRMRSWPSAIQRIGSIITGFFGAVAGRRPLLESMGETLRHGLRSSSGSLATLAAIRRARLDLDQCQDT